MAKLSRDRAAVTLHPRENIVGTGTFSAVNAEVVIETHGCGTVTLDLRGTFSMTIEVSGTVDGTNWLLIPIRPMTGGRYVIGAVGAVQNAWLGSCAGFDKVRARVSAFTSGAALATLLASVNAPEQNTSMGLVTSDIVTVTAASGAAATLTLPAPGAGLRQYLTYLRIVRYAAAVLTASATPVLVTTTNFPSAVVFTFPADAALLGSVLPYQEDYAHPIAGAAQNTAMTVVMPATTGVLWRATAGYRVAP